MQIQVRHDAEGNKIESLLYADGIWRTVPAAGATYQRETGDGIDIDEGAPITAEAIDMAMTAALMARDDEFPSSKIVKVETYHQSAFNLTMCDPGVVHHMDLLGFKLTVEIVQTSEAERQMTEDFIEQPRRLWIGDSWGVNVGGR